MLRLQKGKGYRLLCVLLLLLCSISCQKKEAATLQKDIDWAKAEAFFRRLPLASPDSSIAMIEATDSLKEPQIFDPLASMIINNAMNSVPSKDYLK